MDGGATARHGERLFDQPSQRSVGGGVWLTFAVFSLNLDVARSLDSHRTRVHFGTGFTF
jgi:hypothetical protein